MWSIQDIQEAVRVGAVWLPAESLGSDSALELLASTG